MWGGDSKQGHYEAGRVTEVIQRESIDSICNCGYITLKPHDSFEEHNGGLTVKRSRVKIISKDGTKIIKRLKGKGILRVFQCNACVNNWK